jgi:glyoxylase-like metal-dependent hydrolase (beta-lactamase superfamily II)
MTTIHPIACSIPFPLKTVNCYYIRDTVPTLIDTGVNTRDGLEAVEGSIRMVGDSLRDIRRIIVTHAHTDHAGLAGYLAELSGATIYLHRLDYPKFISGQPENNEVHFQRFHLFLCGAGVPEATTTRLTDDFSQHVDHIVYPIREPYFLEGNETFSLDDFNLRVIHSPGHTIGAICLWNEEPRELFREIPGWRK